MDLQAIRKKLASKDQEHLLTYWDELNESEQSEFKTTLTKLTEELDEDMEFFERTIVAQDEKCDKLDDMMSPLDDNQCGSVNNVSEEEKAEFNRLTFESISKNEVGIILLAGGQGTRLGVSYPKGMYKVGLPSEKSLFQLQAERILKLELLAKEKTGKRGAITWYIMTSASTIKPTKAFFAENNYFGLDQSNIVFFQQGTLPCFTFSGHIILGGKKDIARAPDGNGGLYRALRHEKIIDDMKSRGVKYINLYCVDNILVQVGDPLFMGYCISKQADCANKVVGKSYPKESVGITCKVNGKPQVVEYSEITMASCEKTNPDGSLVYSAANICIHFFTRQFLEEVVYKHEPKLVHHMAKKKIPFMDVKNTRELVKPANPNGIKMEKFVFDVFQFANNFVIWECLREEEFAPLKNAEGANDSTPTYCRNALFARCQKWAMAAGATFVDKDGKKLPLMINPAAPKESNNNNNNNDKTSSVSPNFVAEVEISPLVSFAGEGLENFVSGKTFQLPCHDIGL